MAQYRQSGGANGSRNDVVSDHVSIGFRSGSGTRQLHQHRRSRARAAYNTSIGFCVLTLFFILAVSGYFHLSLQSKGGDISRHRTQDDDMGLDRDFLMNVTRTQKSRELKFGRGSVAHGRDSRYWDKDDRRRDEDYNEEELEKSRDGSVDKLHATAKSNDDRSYFNKSHNILEHRGNGFSNEAGRNELKIHESESEASVKNIGESTDVGSKTNQQSGDADDYDDDGIDLDDNEEYDDVGHNDHGRNKKKDLAEEAEIASNDLFREESLSNSQHSKVKNQSARKLIPGKRPSSKKKPKRRKFSGSCEMKILNSTAQLVEPLQSRKFARFSLQYTEKEEKPIGDEKWEPRFAGHQSLSEREASFIAQDQKINCGFVKGPTESASTGFDLAEDDAKYISSCHIAVTSCIFGNSDRLRSPIGKMVSRLSKNNVCFVMFVDKITLQTLSSEGQMPDTMGFVGLWKIVVVKNLPYADMRRVGKIPKFLPHRLFPSARYSIWLDSKLRLQRDPLLILEYFLWRKNHEYAISNHYDRHCLWEEVAQNKRLNKYNHSIIDEQFAFYQADGMKKFNASDINKLLPSNVPEGSFIVRAHTPMSNLFSCLWFNEVDRFTPRDQLSFAYTFHKLRRMNPEKPFHLHMFKDCERRKMAKLYRHRSEESKNSLKRELE